MKPFWIRTEGESLAQGDFLPACHVPSFGEDLGALGEDFGEIELGESDLIIVT